MDWERLKEMKRAGVWTFSIGHGGPDWPRPLAGDELSLVREVAARSSATPDALEEFTWIWRDAFARSPLEVWWNTIRSLDDFPLTSELPYPQPGKTIYGWDDVIGVVVYRLLGPHDVYPPGTPMKNGHPLGQPDRRGLA